jgi:hypothetical protein
MILVYLTLLLITHLPIFNDKCVGFITNCLVCSFFLQWSDMSRVFVYLITVCPWHQWKYSFVFLLRNWIEIEISSSCLQLVFAWQSSSGVILYDMICTLMGVFTHFVLFLSFFLSFSLSLSVYVFDVRANKNVQAVSSKSCKNASIVYAATPSNRIDVSIFFVFVSFFLWIYFSRLSKYIEKKSAKRTFFFIFLLLLLLLFSK